MLRLRSVPVVVVAMSVTTVTVVSLFCVTAVRFIYSDNQLMLDVQVKPYQVSIRASVGHQSPKEELDESIQ
jgi:hypothetical protein